MKRNEDPLVLILDKINSLEETIHTQIGSCHKEWLDSQEVIEYLNISKRSLQQYRDDGVLPFSRIEGKLFYKRADILKILSKNYKAMRFDRHGR